MNIPKISYLFALIFLVFACQNTTEYSVPAIEKIEKGKEAMVVSPHALASDIGAEIMRKGGNAVDAAVAIQFAIAVVYPRAGNIGGGGFMVIRKNDGQSFALDYREKAPLAANKDMYLDSLGNIVKGLSQLGHLAIGVPGTVDGLLQAWEAHGQLKSRKDILNPAIKLAQRGYQISAKEADRLNNFQEAFKSVNKPPNPFIKENWQAGDVLVQEKLAQTLKRIRDKGRDGFYAGKTAAAIVEEMNAGAGIITLEDLEKYNAQWRTPLVEKYKDYSIIAMPPSSSGGIALLQMLKLVENQPLSEWGMHSPQAMHLMIEAERRVYADRAKHLGDTDFYPVPIDSLLNASYLASRMADYTPQMATISDSIESGSFILPESFETTHTSVVDSEGNAVSVTTTLNSNFGSKVYVDQAGFFLNNEMDDFSAKPGVPNQFGLVGAEANAIAPEKRMLSSMTPTIIEKDGDLFMVLGAPGGSTIITAIFQVFINVAEFGLSLEEAVKAKRFHHQWLPDRVMIEKGGFSQEVLDSLKQKGHQFIERDYMAVVKAILKMPNGELVGVGDERNPDDDAEGY